MGYNDKTKQAEYQRNWMAKRRAEWIASQGGKCVLCGSKEQLEVDHIDPDEKTCNPTHLWSRSLTVRNAELAKCQVLCHACHLVKTRLHRRPKQEHGTMSSYKAWGCRCEACRGANAARVRRERMVRNKRAARS